MKRDPKLVGRVERALVHMDYRDSRIPRAEALLDALDLDDLNVVRGPLRPPAGAFTLHDGRQPIIVHGLGAAAARLEPLGELAFILDIGGPRNRPPSGGDYAGPAPDVEERYLLAPGQAAELVVEVLNAARRGGDPSAEALDEALGELGARARPREEPEQ